jgi:hypothetical protein
VPDDDTYNNERCWHVVDALDSHEMETMPF